MLAIMTLTEFLFFIYILKLFSCLQQGLLIKSLGINRRIISFSAVKCELIQYAQSHQYFNDVFCSQIIFSLETMPSPIHV